MGKHIFKTCQKDGCDSPHYSKGFCKKHYSRAIRHGLKTKTGNYRYSSNGMADSPEYVCWQNMKARCKNQNTNNFEKYGAKGVKICKRWENFNNFFEDMGNRPSENHSIDRIDPIGDYCKENCRWVLPFIQANNKVKSRILKYNGLEMNEAEWIIFLRDINKNNETELAAS